MVDLRQSDRLNKWEGDKGREPPERVLEGGLLGDFMGSMGRGHETARYEEQGGCSMDRGLWKENREPQKTSGSITHGTKDPMA